jgi:hypothetical protein
VRPFLFFLFGGGGEGESRHVSWRWSRAGEVASFTALLPDGFPDVREAPELEIVAGDNENDVIRNHALCCFTMR